MITFDYLSLRKLLGFKKHKINKSSNKIEIPKSEPLKKFTIKKLLHKGKLLALKTECGS